MELCLSESKNNTWVISDFFRGDVRKNNNEEEIAMVLCERRLTVRPAGDDYSADKPDDGLTKPGVW